MPLIKKFYPSKNSVIGVWELKETLPELESMIQLSGIDMVAYNNFTVEKRKKEWLTSRVLVNQLTGNQVQIIYDENRNPKLKDSPMNVSISHCRNYVCVFLDNKQFIGIDIEEYRERIKPIASKFLSDKEMKIIPKKKPVPTLTVCWCIKEALYKYYSKKKVDFKSELVIEPFELKKTGVVWSLIVKKNFKKIAGVHYLAELGYCMAFVSGN